MAYLRQTHSYGPVNPRPIAAIDICLLLSSMGIDSVVFVDLHNQRTEGFFPDPIPVTNIQPQSLAIKYFKEHEDFVRPVIVATENTGGERSKAFWTRMNRAGIPTGLTTMVSNRPERSLREGDPEMNLGEQMKEDTMWLVGDVKGCDCIIVDDIVDTGERATRTAQYLKRAGARRIYFYATHALFSKGAIAAINKSPINEVVVTNSVPIPPGIPSEKIRVISISKLLAEGIQRIHSRNSVSELYRDESYDRSERAERFHQ